MTTIDQIAATYYNGVLSEKVRKNLLCSKCKLPPSAIIIADNFSPGVCLYLHCQNLGKQAAAGKCESFYFCITCQKRVKKKNARNHFATPLHNRMCETRNTEQAAVDVIGNVPQEIDIDDTGVLDYDDDDDDDDVLMDLPDFTVQDVAGTSNEPFMADDIDSHIDGPIEDPVAFTQGRSRACLYELPSLDFDLYQ